MRYMKSVKHNRLAKKKRFFLPVILYIFVVMIFSVILVATVTRRTMADACDVDLERFFYETSRLITDNWCDGFIDSIVFTMGDTYMYVDGTPVEIEPGVDTAPMVIYNQKFLPVCAIVEATGGQVSFDFARQRLTIYDDKKIEMHVGSYTMLEDGSLYYICETTIAINNSTMLSANIIAESLGFELYWNPATQEMTLTRDFQTRRLIARAAANADFSNIGATDIVRGPGNIFVLQFASIRETQDAYNLLNDLSCVEWVEADLYLLPPYNINSQDYSAPFNVTHMSWGVERSGLDNFAKFLRDNDRNRQVIVAVVDTGVQSRHPFLRNRVMSGWCSIHNSATYYDVSSHGTHVAGVIVDATQGLDVQILPVRVFDSNVGGTALSLANGIIWAASRADVINVSAGGRSHYRYYIHHAVWYAMSRNITVIAAAGNNATNARYYTPGNTPGIITVAATDINNNPAHFTNWGSNITLSAPGVRINSPSTNGGFVHMNGTSMSAPHVAAAAAMYIMINPGISPSNMQAALIQYVYVPADWNIRYGAGILDMTLVILDGFTEITPEFIPGDVNRDGEVTAADVGMLRAYLAGFPVDICKRAADVTGTGNITAADLGMIRAYLAGFPVVLGEEN